MVHSKQARPRVKFNPFPHMLYLEHCIISMNNSNFQIFSKKSFYILIVLKILWKMEHLLL